MGSISKDLALKMMGFYVGDDLYCGLLSYYPTKLVVGDRRFGEKLLLPSSTAMMYTSFPSE